MLASDTSETAEFAFPPLERRQERDELIEKISATDSKKCVKNFENWQEAHLEHQGTCTGAVRDIPIYDRRGCKSKSRNQKLTSFRETSKTATSGREMRKS